jgi:hypothetical protein
VGCPTKAATTPVPIQSWKLAIPGAIVPFPASTLLAQVSVLQTYAKLRAQAMQFWDGVNPSDTIGEKHNHTSHFRED